MDEKERIRNMVAAGTITEAEADRLLTVLDEIDDAEAELDASGQAMEAQARDAQAQDLQPQQTGTRDARPEGAEGGSRDATSPAPPADAPAVVDVAPAGTRWLRVSLLAGDLDVRVDPDLEDVQLSGDTDGVRLERSADGFTLHHEREARGDSWVDRFLTRLRSGEVHVRMPAGYGLDLAVTAGDVELFDVPYLRGRLTSGDLSARGLHGIDLVTSAGDIDLDMTLTEGRHRLRATAGDVDIRLGGGSSVKVTGSVSIGSASVRAPGFDVDRRGIGQRFEGRVGAGAAALEVHVTTGDIDMKVRDER